MEDELGGLFNIDVDLDDSDVAVKEEVVKVPRDFQSEEDFQKQRREWKPKIEVGELWKTLNLPIDNPSKPQSQAILHAIEELYFYRRYEEAMKVVHDSLRGELNKDFREIILDYKSRCEAKVRGKGT